MAELILENELPKSWWVYIEILPRPNRFFTWTQYRKLALLTEEIAFNCGFNKKGQCKGSKKSATDKTWKHPQCCCKDCACYGGHLEKTSKGQANILKKLWNKQTGFWRKNKGCILPREYRSPTCLTYLCSNVRKRRPKSLEELRWLLHNGLPGSFNQIMRDMRAQLQKARLIKCPQITSS